MEKKVLSFKQFLYEDVTDAEKKDQVVDTSNSVDSSFSKPETEREAKSRIAKNIVKAVFGGDVPGTTGGADNIIDQTKEVKESMPYKGCGASEGYPLERVDLPVLTLKILLEYLQSKNIADYSRTLNELKDKRSIIIGVRNRLDIKKDSSNQDRFCDALYFIPGDSNQGGEESKVGATLSNANKGSTGSTGPTGSSLDKSKVKDDKIQQKKEEKIKSSDPLARLGKSKSKNESLHIIEERINELENFFESSVFGFGEFENARKELLFLRKSKTVVESNRVSIETFVDHYFNLFSDIGHIYEAATGNTVNTAPSTPVSTPNLPLPAGVTAPTNLGEKIKPYQITTVPSLAYYGNKPMNPKGVGIKLPGDTIYLFQDSSLGSDKYKMMVEAEKIKVGRYPIGVTKFDTYKPGEIYTENCGMQIHRSSTKGVGVCVGPWSAGCQVFSDYSEWQEFIGKANASSMNGSKFLYALIQLDDIPQNVLDYAMMGIAYSDELVSQAKSDQDAANKKAIDDKAKTDRKIQDQTDTKKEKSYSKLAKFIRSERESFNADEEDVINNWNSMITTTEDVSGILTKYKKLYKVSVWDDLDNFLTSSELSRLYGYPNKNKSRKEKEASDK